jgi:hemerythrin-like domain-containing protein
MVESIEVLRAEHADMARLFNALEHQLGLLADGHTPDYDVVEGVVDYCLDYPEQCHHPKEDIVFARLLDRDPEASKAVGDLEQEHMKLAALTQEFADAVHRIHADAEISRDAFMDLARRFLDGYRDHMAMEETVFFPLALASFMDQDWSYVDARITKRDDPLFGSQVAARFAALREAILEWEREDEEAEI